MINNYKPGNIPESNSSFKEVNFERNAATKGIFMIDNFKNQKYIQFRKTITFSSILKNWSSWVKKIAELKK